MKTFILRDIPVHQYTFHPDIYSLRFRQEGHEKHWIINETSWYQCDHWTLSDAINDWLTPAARLERDISWRRANGFYD